MRIGFKNIRAKVTLYVLLLLLLTILTSYVITSRVMEASVSGEVVKRAESIEDVYGRDVIPERLRVERGAEEVRP